MTVGIRARLFLVSFLLIALSVLAGDAYLSGALDRHLTGRIRDDLRVRLALAERVVADAAPALDDLDAWDALADDLGKRAGARVTVIRLDGAVVGDSEVPRGELAALENHAERPEVVEARASGNGASVRWSSTVRQRMMYVAIPFSRGGAVAGVVRAAMPLAEVDAAIAAVRWLLALASFVALGVALLASTAAAQLMSRTVATLTEAARRMAGGDLQARTRVTRPGELGELGRTLDRLAEGLDHSLEELRAERDRMSGILDAMHEGVLVLDGDGRLSLVNPALREMLLLPAEVAGRLPLEVIRHAELPALLERAAGADEPVEGEVEVGGVKPRRLLVRASRLRDEGLLVVFFDVTELRRLEALRRDFVANVSHELRTPITAVRSAAETLRGGAAADPAAAQRFHDIIERNAERLQQLVEDLLDLSRIESRQYHLQLEPLDVPQLLGHAVSLLRERAEKRRIALRVAAAADLPRARGDRRAVEQVLSNLIDNAVKYCMAGCEVTIAAVVSGDDMRISVADNGPGIEARHLGRLFERFYRVDAGRARDQGGTGLGLSIVKHLVEAMGGRVTVESTVGKGSTLTFTLPRAP